MIYRFEGFEVDVNDFRLSQDGLAIQVEPKALHLLLYLLENRNRLIRKQELLDCVWQESNVTENALTRVIALLRKALNDDSRVPRFIETVPTQGYRFIANVTVEGTPEPSTSPSEPATLPPPEAPPTSWPDPASQPGPTLSTIAPATPPVPPTVSRRTFLYTAAGAAALTTGAVWLTQSRRRPPPAAVHAGIQLVAGPAATDEAQHLGAPFIAPDGSAIVVSLNTPEGTYLFQRRLNSDKLVRMEGTQGAVNPFWSPDSQNVGFFAGGELKRMSATGGSPTVICPAENSRGGSWSTRGIILFGINLHELFKVPAEGGTSVPVTSLDKAAGENSHRYPVFLPDGNRFLYFARNDNLEKRGIYLESLDRSQPRRRVLVADGQFALGLAPESNDRYLITRQANQIVAQVFDLSRGEVAGVPRPVVDRSGQVSVSDTGVMVVRTDPEFHPRLLWLDRTGRPIGTIDPSDDYYQVALAPNGRYAAVVRHDSLNGLFKPWLLTLPGGSFELLSGLSHVNSLIWSRDSSTLYYNDFRERKLFRQRIDPRGPEESALSFQPLIGPPPLQLGDIVRDLSPDGLTLLAERIHGIAPRDIAVTPSARLEWHPLAAPGPLGRLPSFSGDGKWIAYSSAVSGREEIYITDFPAASVAQRVSSNGGIYPRWRKDARELFYLGSDQFIQAVTFAPGDTIRPAAPRPLFHTHLRFGTTNPIYDVTGDGQRFLVTDAGPASTESTVDMILNWPSLLPG